ncbi:MAG TPA: hypothetical protein VEG67_04390, partial [Myxococcota bacterium]|nr:hypothetical protein [Myxococcota bacterium]
VIVSGNPGCILQLRTGVARAGLHARVAHPVELLDEAYTAEEAFAEKSGPSLTDARPLPRA